MEKLYGYTAKHAASLSLRGPSKRIYHFHPRTPIFPQTVLDRQWMEELSMDIPDTRAQLRRIDENGNEVSPQMLNGKSPVEPLSKYTGRPPAPASEPVSISKSPEQIQSEMAEIEAEKRNKEVADFLGDKLSEIDLAASINDIVEKVEDLLTDESKTSSGYEVSFEVRLNWVNSVIARDPEGRKTLPVRVTELVENIEEAKKVEENPETESGTEGEDGEKVEA